MQQNDKGNLSNAKLSLDARGVTYPQPGRCGWGAILSGGAFVMEMKRASGSLPGPMHNTEAALVAVIEGLRKLVPKGQKVTVYTEQFVAKGWNDDLPKQRAKGYRTSKGKEIAYKTRWQELEQEMEGREGNVTFGVHKLDTTHARAALELAGVNAHEPDIKARQDGDHDAVIIEKPLPKGAVPTRGQFLSDAREVH